jgi:hypothetical protein
MSMCDTISDRMPAVAGGRGEWTPEEHAHLASCGGCAAEWKLLMAASALGRHLTVDAMGLTPIVLGRVRAARAEEQRSRWVKRGALVGAMALAAALLLVMVPRRGQLGETPTGSGVAVVETGELRLAELVDAAPAELEIVLAEFDGPAVPASSLDGPDVEGLDQSQVERALRSWEES